MGCPQRFQLVQFFRRVFSNVVLVVVHADDAAVDREEGPVEALGNGAVEVLAFLLGHREDDRRWTADVACLAVLLNIFFEYFGLLFGKHALLPGMTFALQAALVLFTSKPVLVNVRLNSRSGSCL
uniref:Secreted protein n=1 Tax=Ixodes ricinus TaxID=34613 RepID=A0A6B0UPT0_IXORI